MISPYKHETMMRAGERFRQFKTVYGIKGVCLLTPLTMTQICRLSAEEFSNFQKNVKEMLESTGLKDFDSLAIHED